MKRLLPGLMASIALMMSSLAINGQSVQVSKTNATKVYIHYMPWFTAPRNPGTGVTSYPTGVTASGSWGFHWCSDGSGANPNTFTTVTDYTGASVQARNVDAHYHPLIGPYDGSDPDVIEYHLLLMKLSGIDGVLIDWYGQNGTNGDVTPLLTNSNALIAQMGNVGLKFGLVMEDNFWATMTNADNNGTYAINNYFSNPHYIKLGDMRGSSAPNANTPLACVFGPQTFKTPGEWNTILQGNTKAFLPLYNQAAQIGTDAGGTFVWPYPQAMLPANNPGNDPLNWYKNTSNYYTGGAVTLHNTSKENNTSLGNNVVLGTAYQGFFDFYLSNASSTNADQYGVIPRNYNGSGNTLSATLSLFNQNKAVLDGLQLVTWNDFSEGTMLEPTVEFGFASLDTIQKFTGVSYTEADLQQVYRLFTLRKQYAGNSNIQSELDQVFNYFVQLNIANAKSLMDCIVNTGGTNCSNLPTITSASRDTVAAGSLLNYQITATTNNGPIIRYGVSNLPQGLSIDTSTGLISGNIYALGTYIITDSATNANGTTYSPLTITVTVSPTEIPYGGTPWPIPGIIQAENYDDGGQNVAYNDVDITNNGGQYRTAEGVDIEACTDAGGGYDVGWTNAGEWLQYTVNVTTAETYTLQARVSTGAWTAGKTFNVLLDGTNIGTITIPNTGGWQSWQTVNVITPSLTTGVKTLRIALNSGDFNINYLNFVLNSTIPVPVISSNATASGKVGIPFNYQITASNTPNSYKATNLPPGLTIDTLSGIISGTPTVNAVFIDTIKATNGGGTDTAVLTITILPNTPVISSDTTAIGYVDSTFSYTIAASNTPNSYEAIGLPFGLSIDTLTGIISGIPISAGIFPVTFTASNSGGTATKILYIDVIERNLPIYPNPVTNDIINIPFNNMSSNVYSICLFNSLGQLAYKKMSFPISAGYVPYTLHLPNTLANGSYRLELIDKSGTRKVYSLMIIAH